MESLIEVLRREISDWKIEDVEMNFWKEWYMYLMFVLEMATEMVFKSDEIIS